MNNGIKTFNFIRANSSEVFTRVVPSATKDNIQTISNILFNDAYQPQLNEFIGNLINRIALTIVRNKSFSNPLSVFKKGATPLGTDIQDIYENPAEAEAYELSNTAMAKLLTITDPDTKVAYYRRNRQDLYTKTIAREALQGAFVSWEEFEKFISGITTSLYSGNYIDEFKYTKALIDGAYDNDKIISVEVDDVTDEDSAKAFLKKCRELYAMMSFPSSDYNAYSKFNPTDTPVITWTDSDRVVIIIRADVMAEVDVEALAGAFNLDKANFMGRVILVDKFENEAIKAVICDESFIQIYDNIFKFDEFYNARTMTWNEYLHAWSTYAICPFANAVALVTEEPVPVTEIDLGDDAFELDLADSPAYETLTVTLTPVSATSDITYTSSDETIFTVTKNSNTSVTITPVTVGEAVLNATSDNGVTASADVEVVDSSEVVG